jgi:hypothetical protein
MKSQMKILTSKETKKLVNKNKRVIGQTISSKKSLSGIIKKTNGESITNERTTKNALRNYPKGGLKKVLDGAKKTEKLLKNNNSVISSESDETKRSQGRPKGSLNKKTLLNLSSLSQQPKIKKERGRPFGSLNKKTLEKLDKNIPVIKVMRDRGRPKGSLNKKTIEKMKITPVEVKLKHEKGRPKGSLNKNTLLKMQNPEIKKQEKRERGRPKGSLNKKTLLSKDPVILKKEFMHITKGVKQDVNISSKTEEKTSTLLSVSGLIPKKSLSADLINKLNELEDYSKIQFIQSVSFSQKQVVTLFHDSITFDYYQREYVWGKEEIDVYIDSLIKNYKHKRVTNIGSIVIDKKNDKLSIIDGQQRLTTQLLIYVIQFNHLNKIKNTINSEEYKSFSVMYGILNKILTNLNFVKNQDQKIYTEVFKFINENYEQIVLLNNYGKFSDFYYKDFSVYNILNKLNFICNEYGNRILDLKFIFYSLMNVACEAGILHESVNANDVFITLNTSTKKLNNYELTKSILLNHFNDEPEIQKEISHKFYQASSYLNILGKTSSIQDSSELTFQYFLRMRYKIKGSHYREQLETLIDEGGKKFIIKLIDEYFIISTYIKSIFEDSKNISIKITLEIIKRVFGGTSNIHMNLPIAVSLYFYDNNIDMKSITNIQRKELKELYLYFLEYTVIMGLCAVGIRDHHKDKNNEVLTYTQDIIKRGIMGGVNYFKKKIQENTQDVIDDYVDNKNSSIYLKSKNVKFKLGEKTLDPKLYDILTSFQSIDKKITLDVMVSNILKMLVEKVSEKEISKHNVKQSLELSRINEKFSTFVKEFNKIKDFNEKIII